MLQTSLAGIKVLDLSRILAGPWCTQNLADLGADVIKIEHPERGDDTRGWGPPYLDDPEAGFSAYFLCCNRGKRSLAVDFSVPAAASLMLKLVADADIVVENYKSGTLARYGLDYASLKHINPRLIYVSITGFGQTGPMAGKPGYDYVFQGMGGLMSYTGHADGSPGAGPLRTGVAVVDLMTGMYALSAVLAALVQRHASGQGQYIDLALLDVAVALNANQASNYLVSSEVPKRNGNAHPNCAPYEVFACSDGHLILAIGNDSQFEQFCKVSNLPGLAQDPMFAKNAGRIRHLSELRPIIARAMFTRSRAQWSRDLDAVGVPWGPINTLEDVFNDPQVRHRQLAVSAVHPAIGVIPMVRNPLLAGAPADQLKAPPLVGEHTREVLREIGLTDPEIDALGDDGAVLPDTSRFRKAASQQTSALPAGHPVSEHSTQTLPQ